MLTSKRVRGVLAGGLTLITMVAAVALGISTDHGTAGPRVGANSLVDQDHNLAFLQNKHNEPASGGVSWSTSSDGMTVGPFEINL